MANAKVLKLRDAMASKADSVEGSVVVYIGPTGGGKYCVARLIIPPQLLAAIGEPKRIKITGTPHEGFSLEPTSDKDREGHALNYAASASNVNVGIGTKKYGFPNALRNKVKVNAHTNGNVLRIGGLPQEWMDGTNGFAPAPAAPAPAAPTHKRLAANPSSGIVAESIEAPPTPAPATDRRDGEADVREGVAEGTSLATSLQHQLAVALDRARDLKGQLEQATGLKLVITKDLRVALADDRRTTAS